MRGHPPFRVTQGGRVLVQSVLMRVCGVGRPGKRLPLVWAGLYKMGSAQDARKAGWLRVEMALVWVDCREQEARITGSGPPQCGVARVGRSCG